MFVTQSLVGFSWIAQGANRSGNGTVSGSVYTSGQLRDLFFIRRDSIIITQSLKTVTDRFF